MSDAAAWVGSIATSLTLVVLVTQLIADQRRRAAASLRAQAERVSAWAVAANMGDGRDAVQLLNNSDEPVYNAVVSPVHVQGAGWRAGEEIPTGLQHYRSVLSVLPPGTWETSVDGGGGGMNLHLGIELAFTDRAGEHWLRRATGKLEHLKQSAPGYYDLDLPLGLSLPRRFNTE